MNNFKAQKSPAVLQVGVSAFYQVVSFVCEDTLRHPPTRQYLSSCVEILGQVCRPHKHTGMHKKLENTNASFMFQYIILKVGLFYYQTAIVATKSIALC